MFSFEFYPLSYIYPKDFIEKLLKTKYFENVTNIDQIESNEILDVHKSYLFYGHGMDKILTALFHTDGKKTTTLDIKNDETLAISVLQIVFSKVAEYCIISERKKKGPNFIYEINRLSPADVKLGVLEVSKTNNYDFLIIERNKKWINMILPSLEINKPITIGCGAGHVQDLVNRLIDDYKIEIYDYETNTFIEV